MREQGIGEGAQGLADELQARTPGASARFQHGHEHFLARAPTQVRFPPHTFRCTTAGRIACSPSQLVGSTSGWLRNVNHSSKCFHKCADNVSEAGTSRAGQARSLSRWSHSGRAGRNCSADTSPFGCRLRRWIASVNSVISYRG